MPSNTFKTPEWTPSMGCSHVLPREVRVRSAPIRKTGAIARITRLVVRRIVGEMTGLVNVPLATVNATLGRTKEQEQ